MTTRIMPLSITTLSINIPTLRKSGDFSRSPSSITFNHGNYQLFCILVVLRYGLTFPFLSSTFGNLTTCRKKILPHWIQSCRSSTTKAYYLIFTVRGQRNIPTLRNAGDFSRTPSSIAFNHGNYQLFCVLVVLRYGLTFPFLSSTFGNLTTCGKKYFHEMFFLKTRDEMEMQHNSQSTA